MEKKVKSIFLLLFSSLYVMAQQYQVGQVVYYISSEGIKRTTIDGIKKDYNGQYQYSLKGRYGFWGPIYTTSNGYFWTSLNDINHYLKTDLLMEDDTLKESNNRLVDTIDYLENKEEHLKIINDSLKNEIHELSIIIDKQENTLSIIKSEIENYNLCCEQYEMLQKESPLLEKENKKIQRKHKRGKRGFCTGIITSTIGVLALIYYMSSN